MVELATRIMNSANYSRRLTFEERGIVQRDTIACSRVSQALGRYADEKPAEGWDEWVLKKYGRGYLEAIRKIMMFLEGVKGVAPSPEYLEFLGNADSLYLLNEKTRTKRRLT
ncbi:MAG: hypothetical protein AABX71_03260, partial [Nanoarchaeota archaeon]